MNYWKTLDTFDLDTNGSKTKTLRVIVEIPKGSLLKYEYNSTGDYLTIVREMNRKYRYPYNYGMIPQTLGGDGDPLDAIVIYPEPIVPGTVLNCNILGIVEMEDNGEKDDKVLVIPYFYKPKKVDIAKIFRYLNNYKFPNQKGTKILGILGRSKAEIEIMKSIDRFKEVDR